MKAIVWNGPGSKLSLQAVDIPKTGAGEVLIEVRASGLCRSDLAIALASDTRASGKWRSMQCRRRSRLF